MTMTYEAFQAREQFSQLELLAIAHGSLVTDPPKDFDARLPLPPMLMIDRILAFETKGNRGRIVAERDVRLDDWFYQCHFIGDPVQPGCLGVDAVWQLLGLYCSWRGGLGTGRALGCGEIEFSGQIRPHDSVVRYEISVRRYSSMASQGATFALGDATVFVDDQPIYQINGAKAGLFRDISYSDYPQASERSSGGIMASK